jgi:hypothetical protein
MSGGVNYKATLQIVSFIADQHGSSIAQEAYIHRDILRQLPLSDQQSTILSIQLLVNFVNSKNTINTYGGVEI